MLALFNQFWAALLKWCPSHTIYELLVDNATPPTLASVWYIACTEFRKLIILAR
jgi:hypothetical protein